MTDEDEDTCWECGEYLDDCVCDYCEDCDEELDWCTCGEEDEDEDQ